MDAMIMLGRAFVLLLAALWVTHILTAGVDDITHPVTTPTSEVSP